MQCSVAQGALHIRDRYYTSHSLKPQILRLITSKLNAKKDRFAILMKLNWLPAIPWQDSSTRQKDKQNNQPPISC